MARSKEIPPPDIGDIVYLRTDPDKYERLIVSFKVEPSGMVLYELACGDRKSNHYEFEIQREIQGRSKIEGFIKKQDEGSINKQRRSPRKIKREPKGT
jgi:hypothetical protein